MGFGVRSTFYASFVNAGRNPAGMIGSTPVVSIASWRTSCAITQQANMIWGGRAGVGPAINASGIYIYLGLDERSLIWLPNDGKLLVQGADIAYWANTGSDGHVEMVRRVRTDGWVETAGGGGGPDGTGCSLRLRAPGCLDPYGRRFHGVWRIAIAPFLPPSPDAATGEIVRDAAPDSVGLTGRALRGEIHDAAFDVAHPDVLASIGGHQA